MNILTINLLMSTLVFGVVSEQPASLFGSIGVPRRPRSARSSSESCRCLRTRCL